MTRPDVNFARQILSIRVDRSIPVPAYIQIADCLRALLGRGVAPADAELPPERILCGAFGVSRMTLRQALGALERDGLIERRRGRGTFVALRRYHDGRRLFTIADAMTTRAGPETVTLLSLRPARPIAAAREFLELPESGLVYHMRRLRSGGGVPLAVESVQIPHALCPNLDRFDLARDCLYRILEEHYSLKPWQCTEEISAILPNRIQRKLLAPPPPTSVLFICRRTRAIDGTPVEFATSAYRGDLFTAVLHSGLSTSGCEPAAGAVEHHKGS